MEDEKRGGAGGTSGRRLAAAIVVIGVLAATAGLIFRQFTPRTEPTTRPTGLTPATTTSAKGA